MHKEAENNLTRQEKELLDRFRHYIQDNKVAPKKTSQSEKEAAKSNKDIDFVALVKEINRKAAEEERVQRAKEQYKWMAQAAKRAKIKKILTVSACCLAAVIIAICVLVLTLPRKTPTDAPVRSTVQPTQQSIQQSTQKPVQQTTPQPSDVKVYTTPGGGKYHLITCRYARGRDDLAEWDIGNVPKKYSPCSYCNPPVR